MLGQLIVATFSIFKAIMESQIVWLIGITTLIGIMAYIVNGMIKGLING